MEFRERVRQKFGQDDRSAELVVAGRHWPPFDTDEEMMEVAASIERILPWVATLKLNGKKIRSEDYHRKMDDESIRGR